MADDNEMKKLLEERKQIRESFAQWRKDPAFVSKSFLGGAAERMRRGELGSIEMEALGKVGKVSVDTILSEAAQKVEELKGRGNW